MECVLAATIDHLSFHPAKIEMIKRWRGRGGRHCRSFDETRLCNDKSDLLTKMSALGQKQTCAVHHLMSALPPIADMCGATRHVRFVPIADIDGLPVRLRNVLVFDRNYVAFPALLDSCHSALWLVCR